MSEYREKLEELRREGDTHVSKTHKERRNLVKCNFTFRVEIRTGQSFRTIDADSFVETATWMVFFRNLPEGGKTEIWRVRMTDVVGIETKRGSK